MPGKLRTLQHDRDVRIRHRPAETPHDLEASGQQIETRRVFPGGVGIGKVTADVACAGGAENRVDERMTEDVSVRMRNRAFLERHDNAGEHERTTSLESMQVIAGSDACVAPHVETAPRGREILRRGDFHVLRLSVHDPHRVAGPFGQHGLVSRFGS
jgi:hypothetical protein